MQLTQTLLAFLTEAFSNDPAKFAALTFSYDGTMTWAVSDGFLTTETTGGSGGDLTVDLSQYTVTSLADFIAGQAGYAVSYIDGSENATLGALVLLDGTGDQSQPNGGDLFGYTALLYSYLEAQAYELEAAQSAIIAMPAQMSILNNGQPSAEGFFLNTLGGYYGGYGRKQNENDTHYANRVVGSVIEVKCNNVAIELAVTRYTNLPTTVTDVQTYTGGIVYGGTFNYDGSHNYNSAATTQYNLFDVTYSYNFSDGTTHGEVLDSVQKIVDACRAAGCHPRNFTLV